MNGCAIFGSWCFLSCGNRLGPGRRAGGLALGEYMPKKHLTPNVVDALDKLVDDIVAGGHEYAQLWFYIQVERGAVRQIGVSPVAGVSIRFSDGGRNSAVVSSGSSSGE